MLRGAVRELAESFALARRWSSDNPLLFFISVGAGAVFVLIVIVTIRFDNVGFKGKTLWDWMELLVVPIVLGLGAYFFSGSQKRAEMAVARLEKQREMELTLDRERHNTLQNYFDKMSALLLEADLDYSEGNVTTPEKHRKAALALSIGRARTLMVLRSLDSKRLSAVFRFLYETRIGEKRLQDIVILAFADLTKVDWAGADLRRANLYKVYLREANLQGANFDGANLQMAELLDANLQGASFWKTDLQRTELWRANLKGANLFGANLQGANLALANLQGAYLKGALVSEKQLLKALRLEGAIMPDGTKYEEWITRNQESRA